MWGLVSFRVPPGEMEAALPSRTAPAVGKGKGKGVLPAFCSEQALFCVPKDEGDTLEPLSRCAWEREMWGAFVHEICLIYEFLSL